MERNIPHEENYFTFLLQFIRDGYARLALMRYGADVRAGVIDESNALNAGYELHFSKPINLSELAHAISKLSG